jgi:hypothetical protein
MGTQAATHWTRSPVGYDHLLYNGNSDGAISDAVRQELGVEHFGPS